MTSKYWTNNHKSSVKKALLDGQKEAIIEADNNTSCGDSIEEDIVTIKATNNMESRNNDVNVHGHQHEPSRNFTSSTSIIKRRPDSLKLSYDYGSSSDLAKSATASTDDVNQSKAMSVALNKTHHQDGKKSTSYDLWVNENVETRERNGSVGAMGEKKLDLPGRVSFRYVVM